MPEDGNMGSDSLNFISLWIQSASDFWGTMLKNWSTAARGDPADSGSDRTGGGRSRESLEAVLKTWQTLSSVASDPAAMEAVSKLTNAMPDILQKMAMAGWQGVFHFQQQWLEKAGRIGKSTPAYTFDNLDQETVKTWTQVYENEFRQFFAIPQLGLTRFYQERLNRALDRFNRFQNALGEFLQMFYLPMEKSFKALQDEMTGLMEAGKLTDDYNTAYRLWIKILEGHYMTLFKSPEYIAVMSNTLHALEDYLQARDAIIQDILKVMAVPTQKDMDDLYKEIYQLKKKIRKLEKQP